MKKSFLIILSGFVFIFLNSCSSPENEGKKIGEKFCNCLGAYKTLTKPMAFKNLMDSCKNEIKSDWEKYEKEYKTDEAKWNTLKTTYDKSCENVLKSFNEAQKLIYAEIEKKIKEQLYNKLWLKTDEDKGFYLYSFTDEGLSIINCKNNSKFKISLDTITFEDAESTKAIVSFTENGNLILTDCKTAKKGTYQISTTKDKFLGSWTVHGYPANVSFLKGGKCVVSQGSQSLGTTYSFNGNSLDIKGVGAYSVNLSKLDYFAFGAISFTRNKSAQPKKLDFLCNKKEN